MTDATWTNLINAVVTIILALIAYQQARLKNQITTQATEVKDKLDTASVKSDERTAKIVDIATKVEDIHNSIPPDFKP